MKIKIDTASGDLNQHRLILDKYNFEINKEDEDEGTIELDTLGQIFKLSQELKSNLVITKDGSIIIYDDYLE